MLTHARREIRKCHSTSNEPHRAPQWQDQPAHRRRRYQLELGTVAFVLSLLTNDANLRLLGALLLERNDEWGDQRPLYMTLGSFDQLSDAPLISLPAVACLSTRPTPESSAIIAASYTTPWNTITAML
jgi:hypothetical protein